VSLTNKAGTGYKLVIYRQNGFPMVLKGLYAIGNGGAGLRKVAADAELGSGC